MTSEVEKAITLPEVLKGRKTVGQKIQYKKDLMAFSERLKEKQYEICGKTYPDEKDKISARGWCYLLEGFGTITKDQFSQCFNIINLCRKEGYIPIDFVAQDVAREFFNVEGLQEDYKDPIKYLNGYMYFVKKCDERKEDVAFWESQEHYIQMMVEKIDVRNLFQDVCEKYHVPIANTKGWSDMLSRNNMIKRYKEAEEIGLKTVLLYYGDFDPAGIKIAETLKKNIIDLEKATNWSPEELIIDHFGLTKDFIDDNSILWIDNLKTGGKRDLGKLYEQYKKGIANVKIFDYEVKYIEEHGVRKCEANAILPIREKAIKHCEETIQKYLGVNPFETYNKKLEKNRLEVTELMSKVDFKKRVQALIDDIAETELEF